MEDKELDDLISTIRDDIQHIAGFEKRKELESILKYLLELKICHERLAILSAIVLELL